jgi:endonuclease/exonuclease/phosphatase family metal-dependent hydrolase
MMTRVTCPLLVVALMFSCSKGKGGTPDPVDTVTTSVKVNIKVMSYNIRRGIPMNSPDINLQGTADVINAIQPDLVALSEVDRFTRRSGVTVDQAKELGRLTGMYYYFTKAIAHDGGEYGDAVLSRFPILDSARFGLPIAVAGSELRSVAMITVEKEGMRFNFASTHLDHLSREDNRILQAKEIVQTIVPQIRLPLVIAGDLNALPGSETIRILKQAFTPGCINCAYTFPSDKPDRTIDYILYRPANHFRVVSYGPVTGKLASDHLPVVAVLQMTKKL